MSLAGARRIGWPAASKPSMTCSSPMAGAYSFAGASRSRSPDSTSCRHAVPVMAFDVEDRVGGHRGVGREITNTGCTEVDV